MAANNDAIMTLAELKSFMDLPDGHISEDAKLQTYLNMAIDRVMHDTGRPLVDAPVTVFAAIPTDDAEPMIVDEPFFTFDVMNTAHEIDYWTEKGDGLTEAPDGSISRDDIGRIIAGPDNCTLLYTDMSWPTDVRPGTKARIKGTLTIGDVPDGLKYAIAVMVRYFYQGGEKQPEAYFTLIYPYRVWTE